MTATTAKTPGRSRRRRRHAQLEVSGFTDAYPSLPVWERELLVVAFARLLSPKPGQREPEVDHATAR
jgi:hypothetical protein